MTGSHDYGTIRYETTPDRVATITLNRPEVLNAFDRQMCEEVRDAWRRVKDDPAVHAVVLRAEGDRAFCAGLGCQIALAADFTVATASSRFWEPFLQRGFSPDSGATWLLPRLVGVARAKELLLLSRELSGTEAAEWGLIHRAVPDEELDATVDDLVVRLAAAPTVAVGLTKRCIHRALDSSLVDAMEAEANALELTSRTTDFKEGLAAFRESRPPRFDGR